MRRLLVRTAILIVLLFVTIEAAKWAIVIRIDSLKHECLTASEIIDIENGALSEEEEMMMSSEFWKCIADKQTYIERALTKAVYF